MESFEKEKGQPVMYEITNLYEKANPIPDSRTKNGNKLTEADLLMKDYIHFALCLNEVNDGKAHSLIQWAELFGLTTREELDEIADTNAFTDLYWKSEVAKLISTFKSTIITRNRAVVLNSFKQLKSNRK